MENKITMAGVKKLGFSSQLIDMLLPEPELHDNPFGKSAAPMKLWKEKDVKKAMENEGFIAYQEKKRKRQIAAEKRRMEKNDLINEVHRSLDGILVKVVPFEKLKQRVFWYNYDFYSQCHNERTMRRWMVNYVKYKMTYYDNKLLEIAEKTKNYEAYIILYKEVLLKISEAYPELKDECMRQIENLLLQGKSKELFEKNRKEQRFFESIPKIHCVK